MRQKNRFTQPALLLLLLLFVMACANAQEIEETKKTVVQSPDTASIFYTQLNYRWPGESITRLNDTIINDFQYFLPIEGHTLLYSYIGNAGLAYKSLVFSLNEFSGFRYTPYDYGLYKLTNTNIRYFHTTGPYTDIFYSTGPGKEQLFKVTHSQNITGGLTLGLDVAIINSLGLYQRQKSDNSSFAGTMQFLNKKENYVVLGNYHHSRLKWRENGGIANLEAFTQNTETDRNRIAIRLPEADNFSKESGVMMRQIYYFAKATKRSVVDSLKSDTLGPKKLHRYYDPTRSNFIRHTLRYSKNTYSFNDRRPKSGFYNNIYIDSLRTHDSIFIREISNDFSIEAGVGRAKGSAKAILLRAGIEHSAVLHKVDTMSRSFNTVTPYAYLSANAFGIAKAEGKIWLTNGAPFNGDKGIEGILTIPGYDNTDKWGNLVVAAALNIQQPYYMYQYYVSNHFLWENSFGQQTVVSFNGSYKYKRLSAGINFYNLSNYVYLNEEALPMKEDNSITISQAWVYTNLKFGFVESEIYGIMQNSSNKTALSVPDFAGRMSVYYSRPLFRSALYFQGGVAALFNSEFYEDAYMPALRAFYRQNSVKTGGYPYIDAFINLRVKRAKMFLVMKHLNSGMMEYKYIMIPGYPMPDAGLRFGVSWAFYD